MVYTQVTRGYQFYKIWGYWMIQIDPAMPLTESAWWQWLANKWDNAKMSACCPNLCITLPLGASISTYECYGLCDAVCDVGLWDTELQHTVRTRLEANHRRHRDGDKMVGAFGTSVYWWNLNKDGAIARAAFCRRMAKEAASGKT